MTQSAVSRIWRAFALQPHRAETFKLSKDPLFIEKVRDIVGLYLNPPERALVLCVDEKSEVQALERTAPLLPMRPGQIERRTHDHRLNGTTSLFAALDAATGAAIGAFHARQRSLEFEQFLDQIDAAVPADLDIHIVLDNYGTHKTPRVHRWLNTRSRRNAISTQPMTLPWSRPIRSQRRRTAACTVMRLVSPRSLRSVPRENCNGFKMVNLDRLDHHLGPGRNFKIAT
jgi:hypothetical protein